MKPRDLLIHLQLLILDLHIAGLQFIRTRIHSWLGSAYAARDKAVATLAWRRMS